MSASVLEQIPEPEVVREQLSRCVQEAAVLRQILRVAERAKKARDRFQQDRPAEHQEAAAR